MTNTQKAAQPSRMGLRPLMIIAGLYVLAWGLTYAALRFFWGAKLGVLNPLLLLVDFILPLLAVIALYLLGIKTERPFRWLGLVFVGLLVLVIINIMTNRVHLMNYGDVGTLSGMIAHGEIFPRWMLGTGILGFVITKIGVPFFGPGDDILLIRTLSALVMCLSSAILLFLFPKRASLSLTLTSPIWLLLCSGYDEYYPFIAPLYVLFLMILSAKMQRRFSSLLISLFSAVLATSYAGFLPLAAFLLLAYTLWRGWRKGLLAGLAFVAFSVVLVLILNGFNLGSFLTNYQASLNLTDPLNFSGQSLLGTPFFKPEFVLAADNAQRMGINFFWTGSILYLILCAAGYAWLAASRPDGWVKKAALVLGLQLLFQLAYFVFMLPRLGSVQDIDLYFTAYLSLAFCTGWLVEKLTEKLDEKKQAHAHLAVFSLCAGSTAVVSLYLIFLGLYALV